MTSRKGQCRLARINHHLPRLTLWLFVAVAAAIVLATTLGGQAAMRLACTKWRTGTWSSTSWTVRRSPSSRASTWRPGPCARRSSSRGPEPGEMWFDVYACFPGLYECAAQAGGLGWVAVVTVLRYDGTWCEVRQVAR